MKNKLQNYGFLLGIAGFVVVLDQWSKVFVRQHLALGERWSPWEWLAPYARIVYWKNTGAAFGIGQDLGLVFMILAIAVVVLILFYYPQIPREDWFLKTAMGMQLGGAIGNLLSRIMDGFVTDFISVGNFAVFNVADSFISIGAVILVLGVWFSEKRTKELEKQQEFENTEDAIRAGGENAGE